ncbi:MAG: hypothetical protein QG629_42 [Patescibacteria group bacterium]|nr:hypothetical protein [Candidatus Saccharibacteria bacterium]MDQ5962960.1 hypothetical protein [Patescibacteria group bacterium]
MKYFEKCIDLAFPRPEVYITESEQNTVINFSSRILPDGETRNYSTEQFNCVLDDHPKGLNKERFDNPILYSTVIGIGRVVGVNSVSIEGGSVTIEGTPEANRVDKGVRRVVREIWGGILPRPILHRS